MELIIGPGLDWETPSIDEYFEDEEPMWEWKVSPVYDGWQFRRVR